MLHSKVNNMYKYVGSRPSTAPWNGTNIVYMNTITNNNTIPFVIVKNAKDQKATITLPYFNKNYSLVYDTETVDKPTNACGVSHYDFTYNLTDEDKKRGFIKVDPYWVSMQWGLGRKDSSGCAFHILKTLARLFTKAGNSKQREIDSIQKTAKRMEDIYVADKT